VEGEVKLNRSILDLLRYGGCILYARHGEATVGVDQPIINFQDCSTQRNLSEMGKRQAIYYGEILRFLRIPIGYPILTSPFCRTIDTAHLAFGGTNVQIDPFWVEIYKLSGNMTTSEQLRILNSLNSRLEIKPAQGTNNVIIAHSFPTGIGLGQIQNMETIIVKPLGPGNGYLILGKLSLSDLGALQPSF
jgi:broad specificity phosphatase PhoE